MSIPILSNMNIITTNVDTSMVQKILEKYGSTFEYPVNLEKFAKEISSCCTTTILNAAQSSNSTPAFEVSFSNAN